MTFKHSSNVAWRRVQGEAVILNLENSVYYSLNDPAASIWDLLVKGEPAENIVDKLFGEYEVARAELRRDVDELVEELSREGLIQAL
ncbi:MAG: PqqD family protein [Elusimicrobia bacterium]|nr:PqqD family protein [Elusimicrobiota bacterium]